MVDVEQFGVYIEPMEPLQSEFKGLSDQEISDEQFARVLSVIHKQFGGRISEYWKAIQEEIKKPVEHEQELPELSLDAVSKSSGHNR